MQHIDSQWIGLAVSILTLIVTLIVRRELAEFKAAIIEREEKRYRDCQANFVSRELFDALRKPATGD